MGSLIYILCALTSLACAVLLVRGWRATRSPLLFWSSVCFSVLFVNNLLLVIDKLVLGDAVDLWLARDLTNFAAVAALIGGLIWSSPR